MRKSNWMNRRKCDPPKSHPDFGHRARLGPRQTLLTVIAYQHPPRAVATPSALSASPIFCRVVAPALPDLTNDQQHVGSVVSDVPPMVS
jgi:hypothetical protein